MQIPIYVKNVYGITRIYIADKGIQSLVKQLTKKDTIDHQDIAALETLGNSFTQVDAYKIPINTL